MSEPVEVHQPCPCGSSSDAFATYDDGHGHCFSCSETFQPHQLEGQDAPEPQEKKKRGLISGDFQDLPKWGIDEETCRKFGYMVGTYNGSKCHIAPYRTPTGELVGQKLRTKETKGLWLGEAKPAGLWGQHLWKDGGRRVVITEGEKDALAVAKALRNGRSWWPVVSVKSGAAAAKKDVAAQIEWLEAFEEVVLAFDQDEPGQKAAIECAEQLSPGKARIVSLPLKDAADMLIDGRPRELVSAIWDAREYRPDGIVNAADLVDDLVQPVEAGLPYPWAGLNGLTFGLRGGELVTFCAGTGVGKSAAVAELAYDLLVSHGQSVGYVALEENCRRSGQRFVGLRLNKPVHLPGHDASEAEVRQAAEEILGDRRLWLYDSWGSLQSDRLLNRMRYLVKACGVRWLVLDHLSIVVSGADLSTDERRNLDHTMTTLRSFVEATGAGLILVSHLRRPQGRAHEEGASTSLSDLRGSAAIAQLSDVVVGLERNQQAPTEDDRNTTVVRVLKNRFSGLTGPCCGLKYNHETGRLSEAALPNEEDDPPWNDDDTDI